MKLLFTTNPLLGHLQPMMPLIKAAQAAGHQVRVATGADLAREVRRHGFPVWVVGPRMSEVWDELASMDDCDKDESEEERQLAATLFAYPAVARARQLVPMAESWRPDVVISEPYEFAGWQAAAAVDAANVVHGLGTHIAELPELAQLIGSVVAGELGTPNRASEMFAAPYLDPCPPSLQAPDLRQFCNVLGIRPEPGVVYPGEQLPDAMRRLPYERTIYLTLGTAYNAVDAWQVALEAVRELEVNVLATTGSDLDPAELGPQPSHISLAPFVSQALILPNVDAVVCHGGSGTVMGALAEGRPVVALPLAADQLANAEQLVRTGAGLAVLPNARTPESIRSAIRQVLDTVCFAQAADALRAEIATMPAAEHVLAELVELSSTLVA